jgi:response regulator RpfG family c-di-GMP phosphodiesterase
MQEDVPAKQEMILVVDDDARVVELLQITLAGRGYQVLIARDGATALDLVRERHPDLVVLDARLPAKSGFEVLDTVRRDELLRHTPIVLISADAATESRLQGLRLGADDYLVKPFSPRELIIRIRRILDRMQDHHLLLLRNEVLEEEVRRNRGVLLAMRTEMGESLNRMSTMVSQVLELSRYRTIDEILDRFVVTTAANLDYRQVALLIVGPGGDLAPRTWRGLPDPAARTLDLGGDGAVARLCAATRRPMRVDELAELPEAREEVLRLSAAGLTLLVPALAEDRLFGILALGDRGSGPALGRFDSKLLEILGRAIVAALQNAESFERAQRSFLETTAGLIGNIEERYPCMEGHSERVAGLSVKLGQALGLDGEKLESLRFGALLHDLGQLERYRELLDRTVILSPSDRMLHRRRASEQSIHLLGPGGQGAVGAVVRHHQEYWDGSGLPDGLRGVEIPLGARIVALANAWDALIHDRPHRRAYEPGSALRIICDRAGRQFDPALTDLLSRLMERVPAGVLAP